MSTQIFETHRDLGDVPSDDPWRETDASMLVGSPGAVSSAHSDRHHNLLVEVCGTKRIER